MFCYIDPGAGSYAFQMLLAAGLAFLFTATSAARRVIGFIRRAFQRGDKL